MTEPIRAPEDTLPTPPAAGDALIAGAIAAAVDSAEPMPAAETAQARGTGNPGNWANSPDPDSAAAATDTGTQQIASVAPEPEPIPAPEPQQSAPQAAKPSGGGFVAQLASFRSEAEAMAEYDRLRAKISQGHGVERGHIWKYRRSIYGWLGIGKCHWWASGRYLHKT